MWEPQGKTPSCEALKEKGLKIFLFLKSYNKEKLLQMCFKGVKLHPKPADELDLTLCEVLALESWRVHQV